MSLIKGHIIIPTTTHLSTFSLPRGEDQFLITQIYIIRERKLAMTKYNIQNHHSDFLLRVTFIS